MNAYFRSSTAPLFNHNQSLKASPNAVKSLPNLINKSHLIHGQILILHSQFPGLFTWTLNHSRNLQIVSCNLWSLCCYFRRRCRLAGSATGLFCRRGSHSYLGLRQLNEIIVRNLLLLLLPLLLLVVFALLCQPSCLL